MNKIFKNQLNILIALAASIVVVTTLWYILLYSDLSQENTRLTSTLKAETSKSIRAGDLMDKLGKVKLEWERMNADFEAQISRIPDISEQKRIYNVVFDIIKKSEIPVTIWQPSEFPIDEKIIFIPDTGDEIKISKFPIDLEVICTFQDFGVLLEKFRAHEDRIAVSNLNIIEKGWTERQTVNFILYTYFQTSMNLKRPS
tara:strand:+ start:443 stop:1042 length:600 start_codon:yes stop_codon:yes gene_type:complete